MRGIIAIVYIYILYVHVCTHEYSKEGTVHTEMKAFVKKEINNSAWEALMDA